jgi:beta-mannosidase
VTFEWQFKGWLGDEWRWHVAKPWDAPGWLPARVPGSVVDDLVRAGEVPNPYFERNSRAAEWTAARTWIYRTRVAGAATLEFEGVDHESTVFIDGEEVAHHVGAFTAFRVEVPEGEHLLAVAVHAAPESEAQVGRTSRVRVHKSRMGYGWDFCPRLVHQGIWRSVGGPRTFPRVRFDGAVGRVELDGELLLEVEGPELWWPNGLGEQRLYSAGEFEVGFRTVELRDDYRLAVNGAELQIRGWNWVPLDVLYGVPRPEKLAQLLGLAHRAGVNLLRVWGGGVIESEEFYTLCDRLGLLVWQEFSQSSSGLESRPSDDPAFVATLAADAREIVPTRAHHPSLAIWCGGNELDADDSTPAIAALREVVRELDPDRAWLPTSPIGERDVHGPWEHQGLRKQYEHYDTRTSLLHSEFGVEGMTNRRAHEELIAAEHRWPADRSNPVYEHLGAWWNNAVLVQDVFGGRIADLETLRRASQWLQYDGLRYAVEATLRRGAGVIPWQLNEPFPNAWCTCAVDWHGEPKPAFYGVARAYRRAPSAQFATCAWGGLEEVWARVDGPARLVDLDGRVVSEGEDEVTAPLDAFANDIFLLDLRGNRYVMSRTETLEPLLDLPRTTLALEDGMIRNTGAVAAIGVILEADDRWAAFEDNVLDLLPGEARAAGPATRAEGWNARV